MASASASSCTASEQQWPTVTGPSNPVSITHSATSRRLAEEGSPVSSTCRSTAIPRVAAVSRRPASRGRSSGCGMTMQPSAPSEAATSSTIAPKARFVPEHVHAAEVHRLELDPPRPGGPKLPENSEGDRVLRRKGVEVGTDSPRAVREGGAKRELHPASHVGCGPPCRAVGGDRLPGGVGGAVRIGGPRPDLALVEMGVQVDEGGKDHRAPHVQAFSGVPPDDLPSLDGEIEGREAPRCADEAGRCGEIRERETRNVGEGHEIRRPAHRVALSSRYRSGEAALRPTRPVRSRPTSRKPARRPMGSRLVRFVPETGL